MTERITHNLNENELDLGKERLITRFSGLTISGRSGTGKTVISEMLAERYFIPKDRVIKTGQLIRFASNAGQGVQNFIERHERIDREMDKMQRDLLTSATTSDPLVLEGRLAGVIASQEKITNPNLETVSLLFVARSDIRYSRLLKRHLSKKRKSVDEALARMDSPETISVLLENLKRETDEMTLETVKKTEQDREAKDLERWRHLYPGLNAIDPFSTRNKDAFGNKIYDLIIDTRPSIEDVVEEINSLLKEKHWVFERSDFGPGKAGNKSFQLVKSGALCESYIDRSKTERCDKISIGTIDIDISTNFDNIPFCSEAHAQRLIRILNLESSSALGRNGFGRN